MSLFFIIAGAGALVGLLMTALRLSRQAGEMRAKAEHEAHERDRSERMAREMLREKSREDVARDLDRSEF